MRVGPIYRLMGYVLGRNVRAIARHLLQLAAAVAVALACGIQGTALAAPGGGTGPGTTSAINGFALSKASPALWGVQLAGIEADGVKVVRSDAPWGNIEPVRPGPLGPVWQFATTDAWVIALAQHHLTWQPILAYYTSWGSPVTDTSDFAAYAQAVAARYGAHGSFWSQYPWLPYEPAQIFELWNEENSSQWYISSLNYGRLYMAVHSAIHAVDPSASVDLGGMGEYGGPYIQAKDYPSWYLVQLFGHYPQLTRIIDAYALHPYGPTATDAAEWVVDLRYTLTHYHVPASVPIDLTEFGWPYVADRESWRAVQMNALGTVFARSNCGLRELSPYDWINPPANEEPDFGFVDPSGLDTTLRPAATAWFSSLTLASSRPTVSICGTPKSATAPGHHKKPPHKRPRHHRHSPRR